MLNGGAWNGTTYEGQTIFESAPAGARALANRVGPPRSAIVSLRAGRLLPVIQPPEDEEDEIACEGTGADV